MKKEEESSWFSAERFGVENEICPGCGKSMKYAFMHVHDVDGILCCRKECADKCREIMAKGNAILKCPICNKWFLRSKKTIGRWGKESFCSIKCSGEMRRRRHASTRAKAWE